MKLLLNEGIRYLNLQQIKSDKNPDLKLLYNNFTKLIRNKLSYNIPFGSREIRTNFVQFGIELSEKKEFQFTADRDKNTIMLAEYNRCMNAYIDYLLVNVIENGEQSLPTIDVNNPTAGKQGKLTEFILKILMSPAWGNRSWQLLTDFIKICQTSSSKVYQAKNMFFDNQVIPFMDDRAAKEGFNYRKLSPVSPLHDKVLTIFDNFGMYNNKNLIETVMDEVLPEKLENIKSFAGYDEKLIDYCLQKKYWVEIKLPGQPSTTRVFFIGNGNLEKLGNKRVYTFDFYACLEEWSNMDSVEKSYWGDVSSFLKYHEDQKSPEFDKSKGYNIAGQDSEVVDEDFFTSNYNFYFTFRALTYACNVYPFKTPYNIAKGVANISSNDVTFFASLSNDDYLVVNNNKQYKIRKTTDWCTKSEEHVKNYILPGEKNEAAGFLLCLDNSLPYDDPNGALQMSIVKQADGSYDISYKEVMNTLDENANCPNFISRWCSDINDSFNQISTLKQNTPDFSNSRFDDTISSIEDKKNQFEKAINLNLQQENLLRSFIKQLLI